MMQESLSSTPVEQMFNEDASELYDLMYLGGIEFTKETNETLKSHLRSANAKNILDMSCGTGAQAIDLKLSGFNVQGSDLSDAMLEKARKKAVLHGVDINFRQADMCTVKADNCDGIISIFNSIGFLSKENFKVALKNAANNLPNNGVFIFDTFRPTSLIKIPAVAFPDFDQKVKDAHIVRTSKFIYNQDEGYCIMDRVINIKRDNGEHKVVNERPKFAVYDNDELTKMAYDAGFSDINIVRQSMLELPYVKNSMNLVILKK